MEKKETTRNEICFEIDKSMFNILTVEELNWAIKRYVGPPSRFRDYIRSERGRISKSDLIYIFRDLVGYDYLKLYDKDLTVKRIGQLIKLSDTKDCYRDNGSGSTRIHYYIGKDYFPNINVVPTRNMGHSELRILNHLAKTMDIQSKKCCCVVSDEAMEETKRRFIEWRPNLYPYDERFRDVNFNKLIVTTKDGEFTNGQLKWECGQSLL